MPRRSPYRMSPLRFSDDEVSQMTYELVIQWLEFQEEFVTCCDQDAAGLMQWTGALDGVERDLGADMVSALLRHFGSREFRERQVVPDFALACPAGLAARVAVKMLELEHDEELH